MNFLRKGKCVLEVIQFSNGKVAACWQTEVPEVAIYNSIDEFLKVRTRARGYIQTFQKEID